MVYWITKNAKKQRKKSSGREKFGCKKPLSQSLITVEYPTAPVLRRGSLKHRETLYVEPVTNEDVNEGQRDVQRVEGISDIKWEGRGSLDHSNLLHRFQNHVTKYTCRVTRCIGMWLIRERG